MTSKAKLLFLCGKMAAGKSTLAASLARDHDAVLLSQDELLDALYPGEITDIPGFIKYSARLRTALTPHIQELLEGACQWCWTFPAIRLSNACGSASYSRERTSAMNCILSRPPMRCAYVSYEHGPKDVRPAALGPPTPSLMRSRHTFRLQQPKKASVSFVTGGPNNRFKRTNPLRGFDA
jgi:hypothetical protein